MTANGLVDYQLWQFPDFDILGSEQESSDSQLSALYLEETELCPDTPADEPPLSDMLETQWHEKLQLIDELSKQMQESCMALDQALLDTMTDIIKKSVHKLVHKSLTLEPLLIKEMVEKALAEMNLQNTACEVRLSSADFIHLSALDLAHVSFKEDSSLKPGDFIIFTPVQQIQAILHERMDLLMEGL